MCQRAKGFVRSVLTDSELTRMSPFVSQTRMGTMKARRSGEEVGGNSSREEQVLELVLK